MFIVCSKSFQQRLTCAAVFFLIWVGDDRSFFRGLSQVNAENSHTDSNSFLTGGKDSKSLFYIYEWPSYLDDVWPPQNGTLHKKSGYDHGFYANRGAGKAIAPDVGLFQTWQFSLYKNLMARLRTSEFRTKDPSMASAFVIPFDLGELLCSSRVYSIICSCFWCRSDESNSLTQYASLKSAR